MFRKNISLKDHSSYRIGGEAKYFYEPKTLTDLHLAVAKARSEHLPIFILGGGTNLLIHDDGFDGLVIKPQLASLALKGTDLEVGASVPMADLLTFCVGKGLAGLEWAGGLPGTVGGAIRGNAGAFGGEIKDTIKNVVSLDIAHPTPETIKRSNKDCKFHYRTSIFKEKNGAEVILSATFKLAKGDREAIKKAIAEKIEYRKHRHPMEYPNIGSIFKNIDIETISRKERAPFAHHIKYDPFPVIPAAVIIAEAGLKGVSFGAAMISPKHPNFIVNTLDARASDVQELVKLVKATVQSKFGIILEEEVQTV